MATNHLFSMETNTANKIPEWARLPDAPAGATLFDFAMVAVNGALWIHGGETADGDTRPTLWKVELFDDLGTDAYGDQLPALDPLWSVLGYEGMGARKQHCAAAIGDVIYFFGGITSEYHISFTARCVSNCHESLEPCAK